MIVRRGREVSANFTKMKMRRLQPDTHNIHDAPTPNCDPGVITLFPFLIHLRQGIFSILGKIAHLLAVAARQDQDFLAVEFMQRIPTANVGPAHRDWSHSDSCCLFHDSMRRA